VGSSESLTHLFFVDDVHIFCFDNDGEVQVFKDIIQLYIMFLLVWRLMRINMFFFTSDLHDTQNIRMDGIFPFQHIDINEG